MATSERLTANRRAFLQDPWADAPPAAQRAARESLKAQIARLERELSATVAGGFPHVRALAGAPSSRQEPRLLTLAELERLRDGLALRIRDVQALRRERDERERRARELLERMRQDPARYKFMRLPVADLGERGCGVWEVRPRLGLLGMLAGWWQLKLSSGCPLAGGPRPARPRPPHASAAQTSAGSRSRRPAASIAASVRR